MPASAEAIPAAWKTGQRVPYSGWYRDQYGYETYHEQHRTFPPCIDRKGECAVRTLVRGL